MPSRRWITVVDFDTARHTYICLYDAEDIEGYQDMNHQELMAARVVEFTDTFLLNRFEELK